MTNDAQRYPRCIMGTCCIPWTSDYQLDESHFRRSVAYAIKYGTRHLYVFGTAGEGHAVSQRQFQAITRAFAEEMNAAGAAPMVGVISLSLAETLDRIEWAASNGVRQFQVSLPSWGVCTEGEAFALFEQVCGRFPELSFMHYNVRRAGRLLQAAEFGRLSSAFENLVAIKMAGSTGAEALAAQQAAPQLRLFLTEKAFAEASALGVEAGLLISVASLNWPMARRFYEAAVAGDHAFVQAQREEQQSVIALLREAVGDLAHMDGAFDLMFVKHHLPDFPLRLLPPYAAAGDDAFQRFMDAVRRHHPRWLDHVANGVVSGMNSQTGNQP